MKVLKYFLIALAIILLDQTSKLLVHKYMYLHEEVNVMGEWFKLHYLLNPGMAFGIRWESEFGKLILTLFRIVAMFGIGYYLHLMVKKQLKEYFEGSRKEFDFPFQQNGTAFQQKIWTALLQIPYGKTISYQELSKRTGDVKAIRARRGLTVKRITKAKSCPLRPRATKTLTPTGRMASTSAKRRTICFAPGMTMVFR